MRKKWPGKDTWEAPAAVFFFVCCSLGEFNCKLQTKKQTKTTKTRSRNRSISFICLCAVARPGNPTRAGRGQSGAWRPRDKPSFAVFLCFPFAAFAFSPSKPPSAVGSPKQVRILPPGERRGPPGPLSCWNCQHLMRVSQHYLCISELVRPQWKR